MVKSVGRDGKCLNAFVSRKFIWRLGEKSQEERSRILLTLFSVTTKCPLMSGSCKGKL